MLNRSGITKTEYGKPTQILANVDLQSSVGCVVAQAVGVAVDDKKIAKAGTPIVLDYGNLQTAATEGDKTTATAVLLHDVDVTAGNANGTALVFGFVNINRLDTDVQAKVEAGHNVIAGVTFIKA